MIVQNHDETRDSRQERLPRSCWRNRYVVIARQGTYRGGKFRPHGHVELSVFEWPSKDVAEAMAQRTFEVAGEGYGKIWAYIGAFPEVG